MGEILAKDGRAAKGRPINAFRCPRDRFVSRVRQGSGLRMTALRRAVGEGGVRCGIIHRERGSVDYERLTRAYWDSQVQRVIKDLGKITGQTATAGRVVPEEQDLAIGQGRLLKMAVLFLDLSGFSARPAETAEEQELLLRVFNLFFTEMIRIIEEYGGTVEKNTGDGLMAYFEDGGGTPPEGGAKRAVACSLTLMHTTQNLVNPILQRSGVEDLHFRIGIDYGPVTVAQIGARQRFHGLVAIGTTANIACKMLDVAKPDAIVIGEALLPQLPTTWSQWWQLEKAITGWTYRLTSMAYSFYRYDGRWTEPR